MERQMKMEKKKQKLVQKRREKTAEFCSKTNFSKRVIHHLLTPGNLQIATTATQKQLEEEMQKGIIPIGFSDEPLVSFRKRFKQSFRN